MKSAAESKFHLTWIKTDLPKIWEFEISLRNLWIRHVFILTVPYHIFEGDNTDLVVSRNVKFLLGSNMHRRWCQQAIDNSCGDLILRGRMANFSGRSAVLGSRRSGGDMGGRVRSPTHP